MRRVLPYVIFLCSIIIVLHLLEISDYGGFLLRTPAASTPPEKPALPASELTPPEKDATTTEKDAAQHEVGEEDGHEDKVDKPVDHSVRPQIIEPDPSALTQSELNVLKSLKTRRDELEQSSKDMKLKNNALLATEKLINEKLSSLQTLESQLKTALMEHDEKQEQKIKNLAKIYENMKPKDAARIFDELEMSTLLQVGTQMSEAKFAMILSQMDPKKAQEITVQILHPIT
jgi:flagellar motility protein MotE (MotC chaperone)